jgi:hypothetical protein
VSWQAGTASCRSGSEPSYDPLVPTFWPARVPNHVLSLNDYQTATNPGLDREQRLAAFRARSDPLSSQGIMMALTTGLRAARAVIEYQHDEHSALQSYATEFHDLYRVYNETKLKYYQSEIRWKDSLFWRRRA